MGEGENKKEQTRARAPCGKLVHSSFLLFFRFPFSASRMFFLCWLLCSWFSNLEGQTNNKHTQKNQPSHANQLLSPPCPLLVSSCSTGVFVALTVVAI
jgi:hypothetical protein